MLEIIMIITKMIIAFAAIAGITYLQINLSKKENPLLGLILPVISFLISTREINEYHDIMDSISNFLQANIFSIIFLVIYAVMRNRRRKEEQLKKMNIQDLE